MGEFLETLVDVITYHYKNWDVSRRIPYVNGDLAPSAGERVSFDGHKYKVSYVEFSYVQDRLVGIDITLSDLHTAGMRHVRREQDVIPTGGLL